MKSAWKWGLALVVAALFLAPLAWLLLASFLPSSAIFDANVADSLLAREWTLVNYPNAMRRACEAGAFG